MTRRITMILVALTFASLSVANAATSPAFQKMKTLVGDWKADIPGMGAATAKYSLHSDGTALVEELSMHGDNMVTVYYPTADGIAMTHYCSSHNQPHMIASGGADKISFAEVSVDNLPSKDAEHMKGVDFTFNDADHFTATWMHSGGGKDMAVPFNFARVK